MWPIILRKAYLYVLYILLIYCDIIVLSQRLRIYDTFGKSLNRSHLAKSSLVHKEKNSNDKGYPDGLRYYNNLLQHKNPVAASEPHKDVYKNRYHSPHRLASWKSPFTTESTDRSSTQTEWYKYSYFNSTTTRPNYLDQWKIRYHTDNPFIKSASRVVGATNSPFRRTIFRIGSRPQIPCCSNETNLQGSSSLKRFRLYDSYSKQSGHAPHRTLKLVTRTTTTTTDCPTFDWNAELSKYTTPVYREIASKYGLGSSSRIIGENVHKDIDKLKVRRPSKLSTTWVNGTMKLRFDDKANRYNTAYRRNSNWDELNFRSVNPTQIPRLGFHGVRGPRPWEVEQRMPVTTTSTIRTPPDTSDEYDYYDNLEKNIKATKRPTPRTEKPTPRTWRSYIPDFWKNSTNENWSVRLTTTEKPILFTNSYPPGPIYKSFREDQEFQQWKNNIEKRVKDLRKPSERNRLTSSSLRVSGLPSLENDIAPLFQISGVEEEDWKFVRETNRNEEASSKPLTAWQRLKYGSKYDDYWKDRSATRRTTRALTTTSTTTPSSTTEAPTTTQVTYYRPLTTIRPTTTEFHDPFRYAGRFYEPDKYLFDRVTDSPTFFRNTNKPSNFEWTERSTSSSPSTTSSYFSRRPTRFRYNGWLNRHSTTTPAPTSQTPPTTTSNRPLPTLWPPTVIHTTSTTTASSPIAEPTTETTTAVHSTHPIIVHWRTTKKPFYGETMSIEEQLAEAVRRLKERKLQKSILESQRKKEETSIEGSGSMDEMIADQPVVIQSVPEIAEFYLNENDEEQYDKRDIGDELLDEHIIKVHSKSKS